MSEKVRAFTAVEVTPAVRAKAAELIEELRGTPARVKWVEEENLHFTLTFLGDLSLRRISQICERIERAVERVEPFQMTVAGAGAFPKIERPRTVWVGVGEGNEEMVSLHGAVEEELAPLGFRTEKRRFRPHMTIGRVRNSPEGIPELGEQLGEYAELVLGEVTVREVVVFSSELTSSGAIYTPLGRARLGG